MYTRNHFGRHRYELAAPIPNSDEDCKHDLRFLSPIRHQSSMKLRTTVILLLLSIFSVYFLCPVFCSLVRTESCSVSTAVQPKSQGIASDSQFSETHSSSSTCCRTEKYEPTPDNIPSEGNDNCCLDHLGILTGSEYQRFSQTLEKSLPIVAIITPRLEVPSFYTHSTVVLDRYPDSILDPPSYQISPRAPPFSLA